jgi:hypothetical protein
MAITAIETKHINYVGCEDTGKQKWLIDQLWLSEAVGIIGGAPKSCKSWFGLDMATSVASNTPCLGRYRVEESGRALIYLAEDNLSSVKARVEGICRARNIDVSSIDLHTIVAPVMRLDIKRDQDALTQCLNELKPKILVLDPLVRLHQLDENNAGEISKLLSYIRELQRTFGVAIVIVHHAGKRVHSRSGLSLRGSSDLHAFGDSNIYLHREKENIKIECEHRSAPSLSPFAAKLSACENPHLYIERNLEDRILEFLKGQHEPCTGTFIRNHLRVNNQRLGLELERLGKQNQITQSLLGWSAAPPSVNA